MSWLQSLFLYLYAYWQVTYDVLFQKFGMKHLGDIDIVGGNAKDLTVIVTGPTSGIGRETAAALCRRGAKVILACRSIERGEKVKSELKKDAAKAGAPKPQVEVWELDLASLDSVERFVQRWESSRQPLHVLVNNAGIYSMGVPRAETFDGFEAHLGSNHLCHFALTLGLIPALVRGAGALPAHLHGFVPRVVSVASAMHFLSVEGMSVADPHFRRTQYSSEKAYCQSKLAQILFTRELRSRLIAAKLPVTAISLHPGMVLTEVVRSLPEMIQRLYKLLMHMLLLTPREGARASVYAATSPSAPSEVEATYGYLDSNCRPLLPSRAAQSQVQASWCWRWSADQVGLKPGRDLPDIPLN